LAITVITAFDEFKANYVNLGQAVTASARSSRNWLDSQIQSFPGRITDFPLLCSDYDVYFGSFDRKTKKRPLDDIDMIVALHAEESTYYEQYDGKIEMTVSDSSTKLKKYCHDYTNKINSRKIINKFVSALSSVPQYTKAEINRSQVAAILNLSTYAWAFDIVPAFFTKPDSQGKTFYIIPDGNGHWMKTDPRIDKARVVTTNQKHDGNVLNAIRLVKYWNRRPTMPSMGSYLLENMILDYYDRQYEKASQFVDLEFISLMGHISTAVYSSVYDPKGIQGDLNKLTYDEMKKISDRAVLDYGRGVEAWNYESNKYQEYAIRKWAEIFGRDFPTYG